jgi:hypothetical protein
MLKRHDYGSRRATGCIVRNREKVPGLKLFFPDDEFIIFFYSGRVQSDATARNQLNPPKMHSKMFVESRPAATRLRGYSTINEA